MILTLLFHTFLSILISLSFAFLFQIRGKNIFFTAINGGIGFFLYTVCAPFGHFFAPLFASMAIMLYSEIFARTRKTPATVFLGAALIPIVPGGSLYNTMLQALAGNPSEALGYFYIAIVETAAMALGIVLVSSIVQAFFRIKNTRKSKKIS